MAVDRKTIMDNEPPPKKIRMTTKTKAAFWLSKHLGLPTPNDRDKLYNGLIEAGYTWKKYGMEWVKIESDK